MDPKVNVEAAAARYTCPQCFTVHYSNDVLFAARRSAGRCDVRQAVRRYALCSADAFAQWCETGETMALLNWRALPQDRRQWNNGVITAVRDLDGSWVTQRVCPCCHTPLPAFCPVVFGWREGGMSGEAASSLLYAAAQAAPSRWNIRREGTLPLSYDYLVNPSGESVLGVPVALECAKGSYGRNCRRRYCCAAAGAVVRLNVSRSADGELDDTKAIHTVDTLLESCGYSGAALEMSAVFLLEGLDQPDAVEVFQRECVPLVRRIQYDFENTYFAVGLLERSQTAVQAVEWLSGHISRMHMEE